MKSVNDLFTPRGFLTLGGAALVALGVLGFFIIGPTPEKSIFGSFWWFDNGENIAHLVLGVAGLGALFIFPALWQRYLVLALGVLGIVVGLYSLVVSPTLSVSNLENPADTLLHLVVGAWALAAGSGFLSKSSAPASTESVS